MVGQALLKEIEERKVKVLPLKLRECVFFEEEVIYSDPQAILAEVKNSGFDVHVKNRASTVVLPRPSAAPKTFREVG